MTRELVKVEPFTRIGDRVVLGLGKTSAPIGAWEVKLQIMTDQPTVQPTVTDRPGHREVSLPIIDN